LRNHWIIEIGTARATARKAGTAPACRVDHPCGCSCGGAIEDQEETFFNARGEEFYKKTNRPVWPHRNLSTISDADGRERPLSENPRALHLLSRLGELEKRTRPDGGDSTSKGKDLAAFNALCAAGELVDYVAGWAIDHEVGLATGGFQFVPRQPSQTKNHPHYLQQKSIVDQHSHEKIGASEHGRGKSDPQFLRSCLINLLKGNSGGWPDWLCRAAIDALEALEFGEVHPIFERNSAGNKRDLTQRKLMVRAIAMVQFRRTAYGASKEEALEEVGNAIAASANTVKSWEVRLRAEIPLEVDRTLAFAKNHASFVAEALKRRQRGQPFDQRSVELHESEYNQEALDQLGEEFRIARSRD
jgi:hypothetical protein